jgi:hypothetical protein
MGKNNKSAAQKAAEQQAAAQQAPADGKVEMPTTGNPATKGLTQGEKVAYLGALQTERAYMMSNTENPSKVFIDGLTMLAHATIVDIGIGEIATGCSAVGYIATINEQNYGFFRDMAAEMGVRLPEFKALPAPTEEQLKKAGISGALPNAKMIVVSKKNVEKDAIEKKKEEIRATEKAVENPADVKSDEQLKASLTAMLIKPVSDDENKTKPDPRVQRTINFYNGYLTIQANNSENKEEALKKVKEKSRIQLLTEISEIVGPCPFALSGIAKFLRNRAFETGSPISSYCFYRRCAIEKGKDVDDQYVADLVRTILVWSCKSNISEYTKLLETQEKNVKNEKGAAKTATEAAIRYNKTQIEEMKRIIDEVSEPNFDCVDSLIEDYGSDEKSEKYALSHRVVDDIMKTYYPDVDRTKVDEMSMLAAVQQRAGIIINMFRSPLNQNQAYCEANLSDIVEKKAEEKPAEGKDGEPKN